MTAIHAVIMDLLLPSGVLGPEPMSLDVRAFLVPHATGVVLVDTGIDAAGVALDDALRAIDADWSDVSDVVITHAHPDHVGALDHVRSAASHATVRAHPAEGLAGVIPLTDQQTVGPLRVVATPGHTFGHVSYLHEEENALLVGDALAGVGGRLGRSPRPFTTHPERAEQTLHELRRLRGSRLLFAHGPELSDPWAELDALLGT